MAPTEDKRAVASAGVLLIRLQEQGRAVLPVGGVSMGSTIQPGAILELVPVHGRPRFGQIIVFLQRGRLVCHRVVGRWRTDGEVLILKGDAVSRCDGGVRPDDIVGRVVGLWDGDTLSCPPHWRPPLAWCVAAWSRLAARFQKRKNPESE